MQFFQSPSNKDFELHNNISLGGRIFFYIIDSEKIQEWRGEVGWSQEKLRVLSDRRQNGQNILKYLFCDQINFCTVGYQSYLNVHF